MRRRPYHFLQFRLMAADLEARNAIDTNKKFLFVVEIKHKKYILFIATNTYYNKYDYRCEFVTLVVFNIVNSPLLSYSQHNDRSQLIFLLSYLYIIIYTK